MEDPVVLLERNLYSHPLAGLSWKRHFEKILLKYGWEKVSHWESFFVHREKGLCLSVYVDDMKLGGKKQNIDPMWKVLNKEVYLGEPTSFLGSCLLGLHSKTMWNKQRYCGQLQNHVWITNFRARNWKTSTLWEFSYFFMVLWYGRSCEEMCGLILWVSKQDDSSTLQRINSMRWWPSFPRRKKKLNRLEICHKYVLKLFWNCLHLARIGLTSSVKSMTNFGGSIFWKTQPNCRVFDELHTTGPCPCAWCVSRQTTGFPVPSCNSYFFNMATALFVIILFGPFARLFVNLAMCIRALFPKSATTLGLVERAFWRVPLFTEWIGASSFEIILARPSRHSTTGTLASGTSGSPLCSLIVLHERIRRRIWLCHFCTLINIVAETAIVSSRTLRVGFPLPTISKNSLHTLFCPLILDHGVSFIISVSGFKILVYYILRDTSFHLRLQSVIRLWSSAPRRLTRPFEVHSGATTFPPVPLSRIYGPIRFPQVLFQYPRSRTATLV